VKSEEKSSVKTILELVVKFQDKSELSFRTPNDQWLTDYPGYLLILHGDGKIYIPWTVLKKVLERKVIQDAEI
jgi:hypothetical protein